MKWFLARIERRGGISGQSFMCKNGFNNAGGFTGGMEGGVGGEGEEDNEKLVEFEGLLCGREAGEIAEPWWWWS